MKFLSKKTLIYAGIITALLGGTGAYIYAKEKQEEKVVVRYVDPFEYFDRVHQKIFNEGFFTDRKINYSTFRIDLRENEKEYIVDAEMPGIKKEDIRLNYENEYLIITVSTKESIENSNENFIKKERNFNEQMRSFYLPNVKKEEIKAKLENGILRVTLPKGPKTTKNTSIKID